MRRVRVRGPRGVEAGVVEGERIVTGSGRKIAVADSETLELEDPYELLLPVEPPEVWCAGVTYERSRDARVEESAVKDVYTLVYEARRPELFLKDAACRRTVGPGRSIGIRDDSTWNVPEPEIGVVLDSQTAGADVHVPFGGIKGSGWGPHEQGRAAIEFYTEVVTVYQDAPLA